MVIADHWDIVSLIEDVRLTLFYEIVKEQVLSVKRREKIFMEMAGVEPAASCLQSRRSTS